jgi:hypothetical protein
VRNKAPFEVGDPRFSWEPGQASALDSDTIAEDVDVGNLLVKRRAGAGWEDAVYLVAFAFCPEGVMHLE